MPTPRTARSPRPTAPRPRPPDRRDPSSNALHPSRSWSPHGPAADDMGLVTRLSPGVEVSQRSLSAILRRVSRSDGAAVPDDHVIVLFGALGDSRGASCCPGLFHLDRAGLMPERYKIIGTSRKGGSEDDFRAVARKARRRRRAGETWERFAQRLTFSAFSADEPEPLVEAVARAESELGGEPRRLHYLSIPPGAFGAPSSRSASSGLAERARVVLEKPFGVDLESARRAQRARPRRLPRGARVPDRPLPRPRGGAEPDRAALRQRHVRADLEPRPHRPRADRRPRDARRRRPRGLLRGHRRLPRHGRHPPLPRARLRGDGAADDARGALDRRGDRQGVPLGLPHRPGQRDPRPVRRLPRGPGRRRRLADGDVHRAARRHRQLALVRRAVLPAHRQAAGRAAAAADDRLPRAAAADVPRRRGVRGGLRTRPHLASTSATRAGSRPRSWPRCPGRRCASARRGWSSPTRAPSAPRASSPTSG